MLIGAREQWGSEKRQYRPETDELHVESAEARIRQLSSSGSHQDRRICMIARAAGSETPCPTSQVGECHQHSEPHSSKQASSSSLLREIGM